MKRGLVFLTGFACGAVAATLFHHLRRAALVPAIMDKVEESSLESFPASDPPGWTSTAL